MREEHFQEATLKVRVPRGYEGFWQIICQLHRSQGTFTIADIDGESNVNAQVIRKYVRLLVAGGFVERTGVTPRLSKKGFGTLVYRLVKPPTTRAPRVRADGSLIQPDAIEQLWTTIRNLKTFDLRDVVFNAATPEVAPTYALTKRYVTYLAAAGYLTVVQPTRGNRSQTWRLKPAMDTGPMPPSIKAVRADAMWDPNLKKFVGAAPVVSEVAA